MLSNIKLDSKKMLISQDKIKSTPHPWFINTKNTKELEGVILPSKFQTDSGGIINYKLQTLNHEIPIFIERTKLGLIPDYLYDDVKIEGYFDYKKKYFVVQKIFKVLPGYTFEFEEILSDSQTDYYKLVNEINNYGKIEANLHLEAC